MRGDQCWVSLCVPLNLKGARFQYSLAATVGAAQGAPRVEGVEGI